MYGLVTSVYFWHYQCLPDFDVSIPLITWILSFYRNMGDIVRLEFERWIVLSRWSYDNASLTDIRYYDETVGSVLRLIIIFNIS